MKSCVVCDVRMVGVVLVKSCVVCDVRMVGVVFIMNMARGVQWFGTYEPLAVIVMSCDHA